MGGTGRKRRPDPSAAFRVRRFDDAAAFRANAGGWLSAREAEHNLLLGLVRQLELDPGRYDPPIYLATVEDEDGGIVGCGFRTPPHKMGITRLPSAAVPALVDDVLDVFPRIPAVLGPTEEGARFAALWTERRGGTVEPGMRQGIYQLDRVIPPQSMAPGALRAAGPEDTDRIVAWMRQFSEETHVPPFGLESGVERRIDAGELFLWVHDDRPCALAGWSGFTPRGVRIGYVFTPTELRGRGYASAVVAAASQRALDAGHEYCFLYTDLANPTSNSIYRRIGYRQVTEVMDHVIHAPEPDGASDP